MDWIIFKTNCKGTSQSEIAFSKLSKRNQEVITRWNFEKSVLSKSEKRAGNRKRAIIKLLTFVNKDYDKITYEDYVNVASAISSCKGTTEQKNGERAFIKRFLREQFEEGNKKFKEFKLLKHEVKGDNEKLTSNDLFNQDELKKMATTTNMQDNTMVVTFAESGARPEEMLKERFNDIDFKKGVIYLYSGKTKRKRPVPLDQALAHLKRLKEERNAKDDDLIFPSINGKIMSISGLNYKLQEIARKAGIKKKVYAYKFRHTRLSYLITKLSPKVYEEVAGHSLQMGMKTYAHLSEDKIIQEMKENVFEEIREIPQEKKHELQLEIEKLKEQMTIIEENREEDRKLIEKLIFSARIGTREPKKYILQNN